jgi:adenylyl-sulfate kinase
MLLDAKSSDGHIEVSNTPKSKNLHHEAGLVTRAQREQRSGWRGMTIWCTGLSGSGKSTIAAEVERMLFERGVPVFRLDGDTLRHGLNNDLGFSHKDRSENIRRTAQVAKLMNDAGVSTLCSFISPFIADRVAARAIIGEENFIEVYLSTPLAECEKRDPHGLYKKARAGEIKDFTGISAPYEPPLSPDLAIRTDTISVSNACAMVVQLFEMRARLKT